MKFICDKKLLTDSINIVSKAINTTSTMDILKGIKVDVKDSLITFTGNDLDMSIQSTFDAQVREEGSLILDSRIFGDIVRKLPDGDVEIFSTDKNEIQINCKNTKFNILYLSSEGYPEINNIEEGESFKIYSRDLKDLIKNTIFAISNNESRPVLTGSKFEVNNSNLKVVSIDGTRLAIRNQIIPETNLDLSFVVPGRVLNELLKILKDDETIVEISVENNLVKFTYDTFTVITKLLEGEFFDYTKAIPQNFELTTIIDVKKFTDLIERAAIIENSVNSKDAKSSVIINIINSQVTVECMSQKGFFNESLEIEQHGNNLRIGMDSKIMLDALKNIEYENAQFLFTTEISPCVIKPLDGDSFLYMVLPKRLN